MKGKSILRGLFAAMSLVLVMPFFSCSNVSNGSSSESGTVSFSLDKEFIQKAFDAAKRKNISLNTDPSEEPAEEPAGEVITLRFEISLQGDYSDSKSVQASEERANEELAEGDGTHGMDGLHGGFKFSSQTVSFENVPVGKKIWAKVKVFQVSQHDNPHPFMIGKSNEITVQAEAEQNKLTVAVCNYYAFIPFSFTVKYETAPDFSLSMNQIWACDPDCVFIKKLRAAKDNGDRFEICKNYQYDDGLLGLANIDPSDTESVKIEGDTAIVSSDMYLPVSEDDPSAKGTDVVFVLLSFNSASNPIYFAITKGSVSPIKTQTNAVSLNASDLAVVDTSYALYKKDDEVYKYYLSASVSKGTGDADIQSNGTDLIDNKHPFCFDRYGNFYALSRVETSRKILYKTPGGQSGEIDCGMIEFNSITCDLKTNKLYALADNVLYCVGDAVKAQGGENAQIAYVLDLTTSFSDFNIDGAMLSVYNNIAYLVVYMNDTYIAKADLSKATPRSGSYGVENYDVVLERMGSEESSGRIVGYDDDYYGSALTDMIYQDGAVYVLLKDYSVGNGMGYIGFSNLTSVQSRGAIVKCDVSSGEVTVKGWTDSAINKDIDKVYAYSNYDAKERGHFYTVKENKKQYWFAVEIESADNKMTRIYAPKYAPSSFNGFYGPRKFIAIKPKQLVIADDGIAFYTDANCGAWCLKNSNRVVTVDLETFALGFDKTNAEFDEDKTSGVYANEYVYNETKGMYSKTVSIYYGLSDGGEVVYGPSNSATESLYLGIPLIDDEE